MSVEARETAVLESLLPHLEAEGYEVFLNPPRHILPTFMGQYAPDAIALKPEKKLAIEVIGDTSAAKEKLRRIQDLFQREPSWELIVHWVGPNDTQTRMGTPTRRSIEQSTQAVEQLLGQGFVVPALTHGWATFEAAARNISPSSFAGPQSPSRLIEALASAGEITPSEADNLREVSAIRNRAAHGDLDAQVDPAQIETLVRITRTLLKQLGAAGGSIA